MHYECSINSSPVHTKARKGTVEQTWLMDFVGYVDMAMTIVLGNDEVMSRMASMGSEKSTCSVAAGRQQGLGRRC